MTVGRGLNEALSLWRMVLNQKRLLWHLIERPAATYLFDVAGKPMKQGKVVVYDARAATIETSQPASHQKTVL